eukprot:TRINITY_DN20577_c0_g1_i3.p1 TRINITY_DN20577_c0_g1~~TRINITY_DN20577_c0_g1_i3.p1  ORF type:complete len:241 (+),score=74.03 TRINITY_DN20577_c0_g1_i3:111-833(+)
MSGPPVVRGRPTRPPPSGRGPSGSGAPKVPLFRFQGTVAAAAAQRRDPPAPPAATNRYLDEETEQAEKQEEEQEEAYHEEPPRQPPSRTPSAGKRPWEDSTTEKRPWNDVGSRPWETLADDDADRDAPAAPVKMEKGKGSGRGSAGKGDLMSMAPKTPPRRKMRAQTPPREDVAAVATACTSCGEPVPGDAKFCMNCGAKQAKIDQGDKKQAKEKEASGKDSSRKIKEEEVAAFLAFLDA